MSGGFNGGSSHSERPECATAGQAEPRMHDERLFERRTLVLCSATQQSLEEEPEVYRYRSCAGWCMLRQNSSCKSLFQVCVNGQKGCNTSNPNAVAVQTRLEVCRQHNDADRQCADAAYYCRAMSRTKKKNNFFGSCGGFVIVSQGLWSTIAKSLDTDRRRRRKGAEEDDSVRL